MPSSICIFEQTCPAASTLCTDCQPRPDYIEEETPIPFEKTALLKAMFKFVIHMMQSPGTQEGLRNLIDTTLPATLKDVMENSASLGTSVYAHGMLHFPVSESIRLEKVTRS